MGPLVVIAYADFPDASVEEEVLKTVGAKVVHPSTLSTDEVYDLALKADAFMVSIQPVRADLIGKMETEYERARAELEALRKTMA